KTSGFLDEVGGNEGDRQNVAAAKIGEIGENSENKAGSARPKTPILRDEPVATAQNGGSLAGALVSTFGALAVVLGAFFALVALLKRTGANGGGVGSALEIVDSTPVGEKARLLTIRWGNRLILAAKTPEKIASLAEITDVDEASALLAEIERRKENAKIGNVGEKTAAIWKRGRDAASVWRTAFGTKGRRR
ncbi:MAG: flagellar biosynthetic protein FliO, partial [Thermoguttaceae bacterium]|nr:flagellar biosynthetic protein FliO [Thermoguttaceae bacterium]